MDHPGRAYGGVSAQQRQQSRRDRLLTAAVDVIGADGVAALSVESVCRTAQLTKRYFYAEFAHKDELLDACAEALFSRLRAAAVEAMAEVAVEGKVGAAARAIVEVLSSDQAAARLYVECAAFPRLRDHQWRAIGEFSRLYAAEIFRDAAEATVGRELGVWMLVSGSTDLIVAWLQGHISADESVIVSTIIAIARGAAAAM